MKIRSFDKDESVFATYVENDISTYKEMFEYDKPHMKIKRFITDETYRDHVYDYLAEVYDKIYEIF